MFNSKSDIKHINLEIHDMSLDQLHQTYCVYEVWQRGSRIDNFIAYQKPDGNYDMSGFWQARKFKTMPAAYSALNLMIYNGGYDGYEVMESMP